MGSFIGAGVFNRMNKAFISFIMDTPWTRLFMYVKKYLSNILFI